MRRRKQTGSAWYWVRPTKRSGWRLRRMLRSPPQSHARPFARKLAGTHCVTRNGTLLGRLKRCRRRA